MCGLNGIFAFCDAAPSVAARELTATRDHMAARGPDGAGLWIEPARRVGLGHRRLSIIDLDARADQPMLSADGRYVLVFNGEIYNHAALRAALRAEGASFRTQSDSEVILALYDRRGAAGLSEMRGMYALAIWDRDRRGLLLARDPYGIKPLYTACDGWTFRFASQVKALLAGRAVSRDPEPAGLAGFHLFGAAPEPFTLYREIRALPAGAAQWIDAAGPRPPRRVAPIAEVWTRSPSDRPSGAPLGAAVRDAVRDSVAAHLVADVPVGVFLSAGIDSAAVLGMMAELGVSRPKAITLSFSEYAGAADDEAPLAAETAARYGAEHIVRRVTRAEFHADLPRILAAMDQPSLDGVNAWFAAKAAREAGLKVALSGVGGDELLAGYPSFTDIPRWRRLGAPLALIPGLGAALRRAALALGGDARRPKAAAFGEFAGSWAGAYLLRRGLFLPHELPALIGPETARAGLERLAPLALLDQLISPALRRAGSAAVVAALESQAYLRWMLLRDADWAGMAHSVEIRTPLVDQRLAAALAPHVAGFTAGRGKRLLADAPQLAPPEAVRARAASGLKTGFTLPIAAWSAAAAGETAPTYLGAAMVRRGLESRAWARRVIAAQEPAAAIDAAPVRSGRRAALEAAA